MSEKRKIFDLLMSMFDRLEDVNKSHMACISDLQKVVSEFIESDFYECQRPEHYADCLSDKDIPPVDPLTSNLPPELASAVLLLREELKNQHKALAANQRMMGIYADHLHIALQNCENCDSCGKLFARDSAQTVSTSDGVKVLCFDCYDEKYFDCHKCKRVLPNSEQGEDDDQLGYGWICKDCVKPMGFPSTVIIAPDFEGCDSLAAADLNALCKEASRITCGQEPEIGDTLELHYVEPAKSNTGNYAIYRSKRGLTCEIGELDWRGIGSLYIYEEQDEDGSDG